MDEDVILEFLKRLEQEHDCIVPQNLEIIDIDPGLQNEDVQILVYIQRRGNSTVSYTIDVSSESADMMLQRLRDGIRTLC